VEGEYDPEYRLEVRVNGKTVRGLLDTGASMTCIDYDFFRYNWPDDDILAAEGLCLRGVGGSADVIGEVRLNYEYLDKEQKPQFIKLLTGVIKNMGDTLFIGRDFTNAVQATMDLARNIIYCDKPIRDPKPTKIPTLVYGKEPVEIPGKSTILISVVVEDAYDITGMITNSEDCSSKLAVANSIVELENKSAMVPITNFGEERYVLESGEVIAQLENCDYMADDMTENQTSNLVFKEKTKPLKLARGEIPIGTELDEQQAKMIEDIVNRYDHIFSFEGELGDCNVLEYDIDTGDSKPIHSASYRHSPKVREQVQKQIDEWLRDGVIRPSSSPWASPIVIVPKKDNTMRMCIDLRGVNKLTTRDVHPLPNLEDTLTSLNGAIYFRSLDLNQGYMQIRMAEKAIPKTAFISHNGLYEFIRMPFGLTNVPATFQRCMNIVLSGSTYNQCLVYLDDIIIFGNSFENHNRNLVNVLQRIQDANLTIKPSKCALAVKELRFLGHIVGGDGVKMDPKKIDAILKLPEPTTVTEIKSFIGSASYYRRFIKDFSKIAEPLTRLTKRGVPLEWKEEQQKAFDTIKTKMTTQPVLCHYDPKLPIELRTDACGYGLGAILLHIFSDNTKRVISYASRLMTAAEKNYCISAQECLAVVRAIDKFKHCLQGIRFTVITDHIALTWLQSKRELSGRLMRRSLLLQSYDFDVVYKSGKSHKDVDLLSRNPTGTVNRIKRGTHRTNEYIEPEVQDEEEFNNPPSVTIEEHRIGIRSAAR